MGLKRERIPPQNVNILLDSSAYTAWSQGHEISLSDYIDFIHKHRGSITGGYVALDVIPGRRGTRKPNPSEVEDAAQRGYANLCEMRKAGLDPMPVFHYGERWYHLERLIGEGFTRIGLGGVARAAATVRRDWLDAVWHKLTGRSPYTSLSVHGFGITSFPLMIRYPWASVDSVSWMLYPSYGNIIVPREHRLGSVFTLKISVPGKGNRTREIPRKSLEGGRHYLSLTNGERQHVRDVAEGLGFTAPALIHNRYARFMYCAKLIQQLCEARDFQPAPRVPGLGSCPKGLAPSDTPPEKFVHYFSMTNNDEYNEIMNILGIKDRLIAYMNFVKERSDPTFYRASGVYRNHNFYSKIIEGFGYRRERL